MVGILRRILEFLKQLLGVAPRRVYAPVRETAPYVVEFRLYGKSKHFAEVLSHDLSIRFRVKQSCRPGNPAHVTLFGPFNVPDEEGLNRRFEKFCKKNDLIKFRLGGFSHIDKKVVCLDVDPSKELVELRRELAKDFMGFTSDYRDWDKENDFIFHTTLTKDVGTKFEDIWEYLRRIDSPKLNHYLLRICLLKDRRIICEYDLIQRKILRRDAALSGIIWKETIDFVKEIRENGGKRRRIDFYEKGDRKVLLVSDTHFDHSNIIKYCKRPFDNIEEMNRVLVKNWNKIVGKHDVVYFLGDMVFGRGSRPASYWIPKLNGETIFIEGNHEDTGTIRAYPPAYDLVLHYKENAFLLVHDPAVKPAYWEGWTIHGHVHNNNLEKYPLINCTNKTLNVSADLTKYSPVNIDDLLKLM